MRSKDEIRAELHEVLTQMGRLVAEVRDGGVARGNDIVSLTAHIEVTADIRGTHNELKLDAKEVDPRVKTVLAGIEDGTNGQYGGVDYGQE